MISSPAGCLSHLPYREMTVESLAVEDSRSCPRFTPTLLIELSVELGRIHIDSFEQGGHPSKPNIDLPF